MRTNFSDRGGARFDERVDIVSCRFLINLVVQASLCSNQLYDPIREGLGSNTIEQARELKMGVDVDQAGHEDRIIKAIYAMARVFSEQFFCGPDRQDDAMAAYHSAVVEKRPIRIE